MKIKYLILMLVLTGITSIYAASGTGYSISNEKLTCSEDTVCTFDNLEKDEQGKIIK